MPSIFIFFALFFILFIVTAIRFVGVLAPSPSQVWLYDYIEFIVFAIPSVYFVARFGSWFLRKLQKYKRIS